jgi:hypothetical protein
MWDTFFRREERILDRTIELGYVRRSRFAAVSSIRGWIERNPTDKPEFSAGGVQQLSFQVGAK